MIYKRRIVIDEEVSKLKEGRFVNEIQYLTWIPNVLMVIKSSSKWNMCVGLINIDLACLKDPYPLPNIDTMIDGASGCKMLSFMYMHLG